MDLIKTRKREGLNTEALDKLLLHLIQTTVCTLISTFIYFKDANVAFTKRLICIEETLRMCVYVFV